jgi:acyl carrier protein
MIPSGFVQLDVIPLTPNGKVDRRRLPSPVNLRPNLEVGYMEPVSATEQQLVGIWQEVLEIYPIGVHDNFFDLGGHSLAASRVVSRVIQTFKLEVPVKALFEAPTVAEMAAIITRNQTKRANDDGLAQLLRQVESMTEAEAQTRLAGERARSSKRNAHE